MVRRRKSVEIQEFILNNVSKYPKAIGRVAAEKFNISRSAISKHLNSLIKMGVLRSAGNTKARIYQLSSLVDKTYVIELTPTLQEDAVWRSNIRPLLLDNFEASNEVLEICQHGFTEMLNNAIDHSGSDKVAITVQLNAINIHMFIEDFGIGIFRKIQKDFDLDDPRHALLELSKGKLTSDKSKHSGEGIFFTSRMFDKFSLVSR